MAPIRKLLVANRGEIASRIFRTAHAMGMASVAVYSEADRHAAFVADADQAVLLGPPPSRLSYLAIDRILAAARLSGADAVHPGFGFLAENAEFAQACLDAGLTFVGPSPAAIRSMGSKKQAKALVSAAGVPVIPGYQGDDQTTERLVQQAIQMGFPVLIKASAGGGGKGMRIARSADGLSESIESAKREATSSFGDSTLLIEKYVEQPRHVEIQILGDQYGGLVHLFERECSIQRRHQKIIEESPSPALDAALRERMGEAALKVARAVSYHSAGTVEFIVDQQRNFYFLEVNTRLQVEHPVTECITGVDIVREQLRVAMGERLPFTQADLAIQGAAIECRLYAEDPDAGFLPTSGPVVDFHLPPAPGLRVDAGVRSGDTVSIHYDPMIAKIITHAPTRDEAIARMRRALGSLSVQGLSTNRVFLLRVLDHPEFQSGNTITHFIEEHLATPAPEAGRAVIVARAAMLATLAAHERRRDGRRVLPALEPGYRNNRYRKEWVDYAFGERRVRVCYLNLGAGCFEFQVSWHGDEVPRPGESGPESMGSASLQLLRWAEPELDVELGVLDEAHVQARELSLHRRVSARVVRGPGSEAEAGAWFVHCLAHSVALHELPRFQQPGADVEAGACVAPMPGKVVAVPVATGDQVEAGQTLVVIEAMKMEHAVKASEAGAVARVNVQVGEQVEAGQLLAVVEPVG